MLTGLTYDCAITLSPKLLKIINHLKLQHFFLANRESVAVEVAMKMALQYHVNLGKVRKKKVLTISSGYHGKSKEGTGTCDPIGLMRSIHKVDAIIFVKAPSMISVLPTSRIFERYNIPWEESIGWKEDDMNDFRERMELQHDELCAIILEPLLQATGGIRLYHPEFLIEARKLCNQYEIPLILDETITGFGRRGTLFAFQHCNVYQYRSNVPHEMCTDVYPDIMCVGSALTGGYFTLGAIITTSEIAFATGDCMMHGSRFRGNPSACLVAKESLDMLGNSYKIHVDRIEVQIFRPCLFH